MSGVLPATNRGNAGNARGSPVEVFLAFLKLGLTSFGGPVAHLGYFRSEFVERRKWLDEKAYSDLVALCQFLPGPASSQVGIALGLGRAGWLGALAAWVGFTLPSALALILFALSVSQWAGLAQSGAVHGLKVVAVAVVAQAVWGMGKWLCTDRLRGGLAIAAALLVLAVPSAVGQIAALVLAGVIGRWAVRVLPAAALPHRDYGVSKATGGVLLLLFVALLVGLPLMANMVDVPTLTAVAGFYKAGARVFGGGHVVLPLLQASTVPNGWISNETFVAGYGAAQAVPGPLFSFAAYLGAAMTVAPGGWLGGLLVLAAIFLPAFLLVLGALPFWELLRQRANVQRAMAGVNAAVVGVLAAALYDPVWTSAVHSRSDFAIALGAFGLLMFGGFLPFGSLVWPRSRLGCSASRERPQQAQVLQANSRLNLSGTLLLVRQTQSTRSTCSRKPASGSTGARWATLTSSWQLVRVLQQVPKFVRTLVRATQSNSPLHASAASSHLARLTSSATSGRPFSTTPPL